MLLSFKPSIGDMRAEIDGSFRASRISNNACSFVFLDNSQMVSHSRCFYKEDLNRWHIDVYVKKLGWTTAFHSAKVQVTHGVIMLPIDAKIWYSKIGDSYVEDEEFRIEQVVPHEEVTIEVKERRIAVFENVSESSIRLPWSTCHLLFRLSASELREDISIFKNHVCKHIAWAVAVEQVRFGSILAFESSSDLGPTFSVGIQIKNNLIDPIKKLKDQLLIPGSPILENNLFRERVVGIKISNFIEPGPPQLIWYDKKNNLLRWDRPEADGGCEIDKYLIQASFDSKQINPLVKVSINAWFVSEDIKDKISNISVSAINDRGLHSSPCVAFFASLPEKK